MENTINDDQPERRETLRRRAERQASRDRRANTQPELLNSPADLQFAEHFLNYASRNGSPIKRAKAKVALGMIALLDAQRPGWRDNLLADLARAKEQRKVENLFRFEEAETEDPSSLYEAFLRDIVQLPNPKAN